MVSFQQNVDGEKMTTVQKRKIENALLRFVQGVLLGSSGILPGVSGGVLCVIFGIYKPLMEVLVSPFKKIKEYWKMLLPVGAGALTGFLLIVKVLSSVMENYKSLAECVFIGLIIGTLPALVRGAGKEKRTKASYISMFASFILLFSVLTYVRYCSSVAVTPSAIWFCGAGAIFGISIVLPGLSAYTLLEFFGLFKPLINGVESFDIGVLLPVAIGGAVSLILLSKLVSTLYEKHYSVMSHIIIGIVVATTIPLLPTDFSNPVSFSLQVLMMAIGFAVAMLFDMLEKRLSKKEP